MKRCKNSTVSPTSISRRLAMTLEVMEKCRRMLDTGATRQQVADVIGVDVKTIYRYLPASE
ncbi:helix-turn-helix domain-containing protein [Enterococcus faecalis]|uniref:helix-turn-helix domain-containing protein n=1 Tax=Enterococcus faecalis TaxID=1351 RepID=UPI003F6637C6